MNARNGESFEWDVVDEDVNGKREVNGDVAIF